MSRYRFVHGSIAVVVAAGMATASAAVLPSAASAAARGGAKHLAQVPITMWTLSSDAAQQGVQQKVAEAFNKQYPGGDVTIDFAENTPYKTKISVAMSASHPPTIFYTWGGTLFDEWVKAGEVMPVSAALSADPAWKKSYLPTAWSLVTYGHKIYGVPMTGPGVELLFENKAVLHQAGVAANPATWTQLTSEIAAIKKKAIASPIALAGATEWPEMIWLQYLTLRYGGHSVFDNIAAGKHGAWNNPAILKAAAAVQSLARSGAFETGYSAVHYGAGATDELMAAGKAAFQAMGNWDYANMTEYAPSFAKSPAYSAFKFPAVPGGKGNPNDFVGEASSFYAVAKNASPAQQKEAVAFIKYATTSPMWNLNYLEKYGTAPVDVKYASDLPHYTGGAELLKFYDMAKTAPYLQDYWDQNLPSSVVTPMLTEIGELFDLSITPQQFVAAMDQVQAKQ